MQQTILTSVYLFWLFLVLLLLWRIWRDGSHRAQKKDDALIASALTSTEAARKAAEVAQIVAATAEAAAVRVREAAEAAASLLADVARQHNGDAPRTPTLRNALVESARKAEDASHVSADAADASHVSADAADASHVSADAARRLVVPHRESA